MATGAVRECDHPSLTDVEIHQGAHRRPQSGHLGNGISDGIEADAYAEQCPIS